LARAAEPFVKTVPLLLDGEKRWLVGCRAPEHSTIRPPQFSSARRHQQPQEEEEMIFVGDDWGEARHDVTVLGEKGEQLAHLAVSDTVDGAARLQGLLADHADTLEDVIVGIETSSGLLAQLLVAAGYQVYVVNPLAASRYRDRHSVSGAKSDARDSKMLADMVRTDRHNQRRYLGDTDLAAAVKVLARSHKELIWSRRRHLNQLRSTLRVYYPAILGVIDDLEGAEALALLDRAPTPAEGRSLSQSKIRSLVEGSGRRRGVEARVQAIQDGLRSPQLEAAPLVTRAYGATVRALVAVVRTTSEQIAALEAELTQSFERHPDAEIIRSLPGLGAVLGARVLAEFGDEPTRFANARARKNYGGTSPITKASGKKRVVLARHARNHWLVDALHLWAFSSLTGSAGARRYYDALRSRGQRNNAALRMLANRWVGILHACLHSRRPYVEEIAWPRLEVAA